MSMKRTCVILIVCMLFAGACATKTKISPATGDGRETTLSPGREGSAGQAARDASSSSMDRLQEDLQQTLTGSETLSLKRKRNILVVRFSSDSMFGFDSAAIRAGARADISRVAEVLDRYPQTHIRIEGHTDSIGSAESNQKLSERRAHAVKNELIALGMQAERIETVGLGAVRPLVSNKTPDGRRQNRRVQIVIIPARERL